MRNRRLVRRNLFLLLMTVMLLSASCGKNTATTMKLIKTDGEVGVENEKGKSVDLIDNLGLYSGYGIDTQTKSFAWIDFDDTKLTKMDEKSDIDIIKDGKKLELVVNSGGLFFNVTKPLDDDESMDIRTSTTICGIRGTCGWVEAQGDTSYVGLFDGKVECTVIADGKEETVRVNEKELLIVKKDGENITYEVKELTHKDVPEFVQTEISDEPFALEEESYTVDDDLIGTFMNGNNKGAGRLTVTEVDPQSANVRLEAFRTVDDNDFSTVFESVGHPFEDGIYMDVSGERVEFTKGTQRYGMQNYILNVPEELKQAWNFYLEYENEYVLVEESSKETSEIDRFLGTYTKDFGSYKEALILGVGEDRGEFNGLFYYAVGNSYHGGWSNRVYTEYSINGNELAGTKPFGEIEEYEPDTFVLNEDGSITATFPDRDFYNGVYERNDGYDETEENYP